jgi:hypothetical protein
MRLPAQYDMRPLLSQVLEHLSKELDCSWSLDPANPSYILK